jgi:hypothetical protein
MRRIVWIVLAGLVASCTNQLAARQAYLNQFVGQPESAVVQAMGVPTRSFVTGGVTYLAYDEHRVDFLPAPPTFAPWYYGGYGAFPPQVVQFNCETTFEVADNKIRAFTLRGNACG